MKSVVISIGGSVIVPDSISSSFLEKLRKLLVSFSRKGRAVLVIGGGKTCRSYQKAASEVRRLTNNELDWLGIEATKLNAFLVKTVLGNCAHDKVISNPTAKIKTKKRIIIASGWKPGNSTDYDAVLLAKNLGIRTVINMSNIDYVYDKDPNKFSNARPIMAMSWQELQELVGTAWKPGMNAPFDPVATGLARRLGLRLIIVGSSIENLRKVLNCRPFKGTVVE